MAAALLSALQKKRRRSWKISAFYSKCSQVWLMMDPTLTRAWGIFSFAKSHALPTHNIRLCQTRSRPGQLWTKWRKRDRNLWSSQIKEPRPIRSCDSSRRTLGTQSSRNSSEKFPRAGIASSWCWRDRGRTRIQFPCCLMGGDGWWNWILKLEPRGSHRKSCGDFSPLLRGNGGALSGEVLCRVPDHLNDWDVPQILHEGREMTSSAASE